MRMTSRNKGVEVMTVCVMLLSVLAAGAVGAQARVNIALGRKYTLEPTPNYQHCTDAGDAVQLTDGIRSQGYFWTQHTTVGWSGAALPTVTIDLGQVRPISGASFNTAAGVAGVQWPMSLFIFVSPDNRTWTFVGDLVGLSREQPRTDGYALHCYQSDDLKTHGRYVKVVCVPGGTYTFVDEIEIYRGPDDFLQLPLAGEPIMDVGHFCRAQQVSHGVKRRLRTDLVEIRAGLKDIDSRKQMEEELLRIEQQIPDVMIAPRDDFKTVFPISDLHRRLFAVQAAAWRARGIKPLTVWQKNHWDMLSPTEQPLDGAAQIVVAMMRNEYRSAAFNLTNADDRDVELMLAIEGLPGGPNPQWITLHEVPFTDTKSGVAVAAALPLAERAGQHYRIRVPQGMTRQIWLTFHSSGIDAGEYSGEIVSRRVRVPVNVRIYPFDFPDRPSLHLGGWDYTDTDARYEITTRNRDALIQHLREHFVDTPWATSRVMPTGKYDARGQMTEEPSADHFREWVRRWPNAANYYVFASVSRRFCGFEPDSEAFENAVAQWIRWWVAALESQSIKPSQLGLLLVDEPHTHEADDVIIAYAKVIRKAAPGVVIWNDPTWRKPWQARPELFELSTVLCPNLPMWIGEGKAFADFYVKQRDAGRVLWFYSCSGPGRLLDPYSYHRMQHWFCLQYGARGSGFWAFGDSNGSSSWNEYSAKIGAYTPVFLDAESVTAGKHMEAIREGIEDYEYFRMLSDRIAELEAKGVKNAAIADARKLLDAPERVTASMSEPAMMNWSRPKDRSIADTVCVEVLDMLLRLQ